LVVGCKVGTPWDLLCCMILRNIQCHSQEAEDFTDLNLQEVNLEMQEAFSLIYRDINILITDE